MQSPADIFQETIDMIDGKTPPVETLIYSSYTALPAFQSVLSQTMLPRRICMRAGNGHRVSVIAENRRIVKIAEVHPSGLWENDQAPHTVTCSADDPGYIHPLASALSKIAESGDIRITRTLLADPLKGAGKGYPASMLSDYLKKEQVSEHNPDPVTGFYDAFPELARATFGKQTHVDVPATSAIDPEWLHKKAEAVRETLTDRPGELRLLTLSGERPLVVALVWFKESGCIVATHDQDRFDALQGRIETLRHLL